MKPLVQKLSAREGRNAALTLLSNNAINGRWNMQLKKYRELAGMTQAELGDKISVTQQAIANYENQHRAPSVRMCLDIIKALKKSGVDVTIEGLFG